MDFVHTKHSPGSCSRFAGETILYKLVRNQTPRGHLLTLSSALAGEIKDSDHKDKDGNVNLHREELYDLLKKLNFWSC